MDKDTKDLIVSILAVIISIFVIPAFVKPLWNYIMPMMFGLMKITYWQAVAIWLLSRFMFGSINKNK